jgi:dTDP-4-dehydrorhamnose reductase
MRVLILGGGGMLGHKLWQAFHLRYDTYVSARSGYREYARYGLFDPDRMLGGVDALDLDGVTRALAAIRPDVVVNGIGIIKQLPAAQDPIVSLSVNSLFPHRLANLCRAAGIRLLHISTDCVFSGRTGGYTEDSVSDAEDLYGRSKYLGEVGGPGCLTLRTSIIGRELNTTSGLVEWFLSQRGKKVQGYARAVYTGLTTLALASVIADLIENYPALSGLYQVSSEPISKFDLLELVRMAFRLPVEIQPTDAVVIDRSLNSARFRSAIHWTPPAWPAMIAELAADPTPYEAWRSARS